MNFRYSMMYFLKPKKNKKNTHIKKCDTYFVISGSNFKHEFKKLEVQ